MKTIRHLKLLAHIGLLTWHASTTITFGQTNMSRPHIICDAPLFDYGAKPTNSDVEHEFLIRNTGDVPLVISQVRSGCGCTQARLNQNTILPGSNAVLSARLSLKGVVGHKETHIYLHSNDPDSPVYQCLFSGSAVVELSVTPSQITFIYTPLTLPSEQRVVVDGRTAPTNRITAIQAQGSFFNALIETNTPGYGVILVTPATNTPPETLTGSLIISTDHPRFSCLTIPIQSTVVRYLSASPPEITYGPRETTPPNNVRYVIVRGLNDQSFNVTNVVVIPPVFPARLHSLKPTWARLKVGPLPDALSSGAVIRVYADIPGSTPLDIPVRPAPHL